MVGVLSAAMTLSTVPTQAIFADAPTAEAATTDAQASKDGSEARQSGTSTKAEDAKTDESKAGTADAKVAEKTETEKTDAAKAELKDEQVVESAVKTDEKSEQTATQAPPASNAATTQAASNDTAIDITPSTGGYSIKQGGTYNLLGGSSSKLTNYSIVRINTRDKVTINLKGNLEFNTESSIINAMSGSNVTINAQGYTITNTKDSGWGTTVKAGSNSTVVLKGGQYTGGPYAVLSGDADATITLDDANLYGSGLHVIYGVSVNCLNIKGDSKVKYTGKESTNAIYATGFIRLYDGLVDNGESKAECISTSRLYMVGGTVTASNKLPIAISAGSVSISGGKIKNAVVGVKMDDRSSYGASFDGSPTFENVDTDICLNEGRTLSLGNKFDSVLRVATVDSISGGGKRQISSSYTDKSMLEHIVPADDSLVAGYEEDPEAIGYIYFKSAHTHAWAWSSDQEAGTITVKCTAGDCEYANGVSATLKAPDAAYTGQPYAGAATTVNNIPAEAGTPTITYVGRDDTEYAESANAPTEIGDYTAKLTIGGQTVTKDFKITKAKVAAPAEDGTEFTYNGADQTYGIRETDQYTVKGNVQKDAGTRTVTVSLKDPSKAEWADGTKGDKTYEFKIAPRKISVGGIVALGKTYDGTTTAELDLSGVALNGKIDGDELSVAAAGDFEDANAGEAKTVKISYAGLEGAASKNYKLDDATSQKTATATISRAKGNVTVDDIEDKTFGCDPFKLEVGGTFDGELSYQSSNPSVATVAEDGTVTITGAGTATITVTAAAGANYTEASSSTDITVAKAKVALPAKDATHYIYNGSDQTYGITETPLYTVSGNVQKDADTHKVTVALKDKANTVWADGGTDDLTYEFKIDQAKVKVSGIKAADKTYDGNVTADLDFSDVVLDGKVDGDDLGVAAAGEFADKNAGEGKDVKIDIAGLTGAAKDNYVLADEGQQTSATATISRKKVSVGEVKAKDKVYDGKTTAELDLSGVAIGGVLDGDEVSLIAGGDFESADAGEGKTVKISYAGLEGTDGANYEVETLTSQEAATANITRAQGEVKVGKVDAKKVGGKPFKLDVSVKGDGKLSYKSSDENVATVSDDGTVTIKGAGTAVITVTAAQGTNYEEASATTELTVTKSASPKSDSKGGNGAATGSANGGKSGGSTLAKTGDAVDAAVLAAVAAGGTAIAAAGAALGREERKRS